MPAYPNGISEREVLEGCIRKERRFQKMLYDTYSSRMLGLCVRYAKSHPLAEDLLQEGFIRVFSNIKMFRFEGSFEGWMKRIIVNTVVENLRQSVKMYSIEEVNGIEHKALEHGIEDELNTNELLKIIQNLPDGFRTIFNLFAIEGYTHHEISKMLKITEGTSKSQLARARVLLQKKILESTQYKNYEAAAQSK